MLLMEDLERIENQYNINFTDKELKYTNIPYIKDEEVVTIQQEDFKDEPLVAGCDMKPYLTFYMLYLTYNDDLFLGPGNSNEWIRLMLSTKYDKDYVREPCIELQAGQENGYYNEPLLISAKSIDLIMKYLQRVKKHLIQ